MDEFRDLENFYLFPFDCSRYLINKYCQEIELRRAINQYQNGNY